LAAVALSLGVFTAAGTASAAPIQATSGMTSPSLQLEDAGYRRAQRQSLYVEDYHGLDYSVRSYRATPHGGSDEIRELQRRFPETLWPPSMRYFPYR
jgi:hypothetical protein